jgi:prepilin-type N-terminal cleavage/methylation domain-containing protein
MIRIARLTPTVLANFPGKVTNPVILETEYVTWVTIVRAVQPSEHVKTGMARELFLKGSPLCGEAVNKLPKTGALPMRHQRGFSLIELLIVVVIIGIIAAIAIPNLLASRRAANEGSSISALRTIHGAQNTYASTQGNGDYAGTPAGLDGVALTTLGSFNIVDPTLATGTKSGYVFTTGTTLKSATNPASFCTRSVPTTIGGVTATGARCFGIATDGVIMTNTAAGSNCGCAIDANNSEFVGLASPLAN